MLQCWQTLSHTVKCMTIIRILRHDTVPCEQRDITMCWDITMCCDVTILDITMCWDSNLFLFNSSSSSMSSVLLTCFLQQLLSAS